MADAAGDGARPLIEDTRPAPITPYDHALKAFLDDAFEAYPVFATAIGYHAYDDRWPDFGDTGREAQRTLLQRHRDAFLALPDADLEAGEAIDRGIVVETIDSLLFQLDVLEEERWDALSYVYQLGSGLFSLLARDFAPWHHRGRAALGRIRGIPAVLDAARANLTGTADGRPVSLLHTETALSQLDGVAELIDETLQEAARNIDSPEGERLRNELERAATTTHEALSGFRSFLADDLKPRSEGEGRLGPELFQEKLRHTLAADVSAAELLARARRDYEVVRGEMIRIAREQWPVMFGDEPIPDAPDAEGRDVDSQVVRRVLDEVATEHRQPDELLDWCLEENGRIEAFCRERDVIGLPDDPLRITWTPMFMRAYGGAFLDAPGPLDKGQAAYFWITPPGADWPPERTESYLREDNDRMLSLLVIHEGVPGHYLQLAWSNKTPNLTRSIFSSGMFAEGWAVYVTQVMMDLGYGDHDPRLWITHWKFYLRAITNAIMDVLIHTEGMTEEQAMDLMVRGGFQEEQEARAKWLRARLTSTQLSTYYLGSDGMWDLELEARRRAAEQTGGDPSSLPQPRVVGGLGETPGFVYREHLESVISHGTPPVKWVKRILFGT
jgi:uncharacterized protein (DUF885 family)